MKHFNLLNKVLNFSAERYLRTAGNLFIYDGDYETALCMVDKTLEIEPDNTRALVLKGDILFCLNRDIEALHILSNVIKIDPNCAEAYISKAGVLDVLGKSREALNCCNKALSLISKQNEYLLPSLYDQKMILLIRLKKYREAQDVLKESSGRLLSEDYNYLVSYYKALIERCCKSRGPVKERTDRLALRVINGTMATRT